jgi:hypothetical protein
VRASVYYALGDVRIEECTLPPPGSGEVVLAIRAAVAALLHRDVAVMATVHVHHHPFTDALKRQPYVRVPRVTESNRDALPGRLAAEPHPVGAAGRAR